MKNTIVKLTNVLRDAQPLEVEQTEVLIDDSTNASAVECAAAAATCLEISETYKDYAARLNKEALDRASSKGLTCDYSKAELNEHGELLMWETNNTSNKYWVRVFPNGDWFNVRKANNTLRSLLVNALNSFKIVDPLANDVYDMLLNNPGLLKLTFDWDYHKLNDLKVNNNLPSFIKSNESTNLYNDWTLFGPRADEIKEDDVRPYDGMSPMLTIDITFIV